ncbi:gene transfer agent family protein [Phaeobacter sp. PT47_59]|uniref:gene transfer agent family protein n=1 Tax=Phaeobacter sp. PT47_59 TaxID=3029979 RepID=UPI0023809417|nr:gene transfer agent family protein [Phaeobacter sp. PT47_59]MDE4172640.1 gene transfer agent family protein [Phaeobacter sp. PT47_59]
MANPFAGEVEIVIDGRAYALKLTLGALANLEQSLADGSLVDLVKRFEEGRFSARDILSLIAAGLEGGGHDLKAADLAQAEIDGGPMAAARIAAQLLARSFTLPEEQE